MSRSHFTRPGRRHGGEERKKHTHRGDVLEAAVKKNPLSIIQLVKRMGISRGTYYNHKDDPNLPFEHIEKYGKVLGYDFTSDFPEMHKYAFEEPIAPYGNPKNFDEAVKQKDYWKDKYLNLLEKYNKVIEERMGK